MVKDGKAYKYAEWCVDEPGRMVPKYVKIQARKWLAIADGRDPEACVDEDAYGRICKLLKLMVHPDLRCSIYDGLEDYAWFFIAATLCTVCRAGSGAGAAGAKVRYYETALLEIARKNFKTFNSAVIFILLMLTEPEFSRFFSVAPDLALSSELKNAIRKIIKCSPALYDEEEPAFKILVKQIRCTLTDSEYTPLAYSQDAMDGRLANAYLADEAAAMDDYPVEAMRSSQITLLNKLGIIISTQYPNDNNVMLTEIDMAKKILNDQPVVDRRYFALLYEPDDDLTSGEAWKTDDRVIYQSNPVAVSHRNVFDSIVKKRETAILYESKRENYLCKHNNILYRSLGTEGYIDIQKVRECRWAEDKGFWRGKRVYCGLDLSQTEDNTAFSMVAEWEGMVYAKAWCFVPAGRLEAKSKKEGVDYRTLIKAGECFACGDEVVDYGFVEQFIMNLPREYGAEVMQIGYDRYNAISSVQKLEGAGFECVEIKQHSSVLHAPTKLLKELVLKKLFRYAENRMLEINFQNARCAEDTNLNKFLSKKRSSGKIDMVASLLNAMYLLQQEQLYGMQFVIQY